MVHGVCVDQKTSRSDLQKARRPKTRKRRPSGYQPEWIHVSEAPFSKAHVYRLINAGLLESALFDALKLGRGIRLIRRRSLEALIEREAAK
jgi:hypothetical protein